jgi:hypothetical protein
MSRSVKYIIKTVAALTLVVSAAAAAASTPRFVAAHRENGVAWLLDSNGQALYLQKNGDTPVESVRLTDPQSHPIRWGHNPTGLARWGKDWLVVNGERKLFQFSAGGVLEKTTDLPGAITEIAVSGRVLWVYDSLPSTHADRVWQSTNLVQFAPIKVQIVDDRNGSKGSRLVRAQLIWTPGRAGEVYFAHALGAPEVMELSVKGAAHSIPFAYSRSKARALLDDYVPGNDDLEKYSTPLRDMATEADGSLLVLRNREDVRRTQGITLERGLRIDRYVNGRHAATATLPQLMRWILHSDTRSVTALSESGEVITAKWDRPVPGGILAD